MDAERASLVAEDGALLICKDCGGPFWITDGERGYYRARGLAEPKRCKGCREKKKIAQSKYDGLDAILTKLGDTNNRQDGRVMGIYCFFGGFR